MVMGKASRVGCAVSLGYDCGDRWAIYSVYSHSSELFPELNCTLYFTWCVVLHLFVIGALGSVKYCYYLVCNYDYAPILGGVIYRTHPTTPATKCGVYGVSKDKNYPNLCDNNGRFYDQSALDEKEVSENMPP